MEHMIEDCLSASRQDAPPIDIVEVVRRYGVDIEAGHWRSDQPLAMAFTKDDLMIIKQDLSHIEKRFVIAHEFAHFFLAHEPVHGRCPDEFAARILVPRSILDPLLRAEPVVGKAQIKKLAEIFEIPTYRMVERISMIKTPV